jgi:hypothetical protein
MDTALREYSIGFNGVQGVHIHMAIILRLGTAGFAVARSLTLAMTPGDCSMFNGYGYVFITLLFFILNNVNIQKMKWP